VSILIESRGINCRRDAGSNIGMRDASWLNWKKSAVYFLIACLLTYPIPVDERLLIASIYVQE